MRVFVFLVALIALLSITGAGKTNCERRIRKYERCLKAGYQSNLGCESGNGNLRKRKFKRCARLERKVKKCDYVCSHPQTVDLNSCKRENYDFMGADIRDFNSGSFEECARICRETSNCQSFTFRRSDANCWLKYKRGGAKGPSPNNQLISMNIDCSPKFDPSTRECVMDDTDFWSADLINFKSAGYEECNRDCFDAADCKSFTFRKSDNYCWLKYKAGGLNGPSHYAGLLSRNMSC